MIAEKLVDVALNEEVAENGNFKVIPFSQLAQYLEDNFNKNLSLDYVLLRYRDWETDRKSTRLNSSHSAKSRMPSSA